MSIFGLPFLPTLAAGRRSAIEWAAIGGVIALDFVCAAVTGIPMEGMRAGYPALVGLMLGVWFVMSWASRMTGVAQDTAWVAEAPLKLSLAITALATLQYYAVSLSSARPLADDVLIASDRAFGFDWVTVCQWLLASPWLTSILARAYEALAPEAAIVFFLLVLVAPERARHFPTAVITSLLLTIAFLWLVPVEGAFAHYNITSPPSFVVAFHALRAHEIAVVPSISDGIISFPSYHACGAILLTYFLRRIPIAFPIAAVVNTLMIFASIPFGGHYLADVLAGIAVASTTIAFMAPRASAQRLKWLFLSFWSRSGIPQA